MDVRDESATAGRAAVPGGVVCGLVTAASIGAVLGSLGAYQVHDYADQDVSIGLAGAFFAVIAVVILFALAGRLLGLRRPQGHLVVAVIFVPAAIAPLVLGAERDRLEAGLIWGAAAVAAHVLTAYATAGRWRRWAAAGLVLPCAAAALLTWGCQHRWRAQKFEAVGLPLAVPEVPGYRLTGTWAGRYSVSMTLRDSSGRRVYAVIRRAGCGAAAGVFCLPDGAALELTAGAGAADLPAGVTVRPAGGSVLADHPDDATMSEPD